MSHNNGMVIAPLTVADVNAVLGTTHTDVGALCQDSHINKWALYKPVRLATMKTASQFDKNTNSWKNDATWFYGDVNGQRWGMLFDLFYGIGNINTRTTSGVTYREPTSGFFYALMRDNLHWTYYKPVGGTASPYRLADFAGYNHRVPNPLPYSYTKTAYVTGAVDTKVTYTLDCAIRQPSDELIGGLTLLNMTIPASYQVLFPNLGELYVGCLWYNTTMDDCFWQCSSVQLKALYNLDATQRAKALRVSLTAAEFTDQFNKNHKDWKTRVFLCSKQLDYCENLVASQGHILIAGDEAAATCTFAIAGSLVVSQFTAVKAGTTVTISIDVTNNTGSSQTISTPKVQLLTTTTQVVQDSYTWSNQTIANGDTVTFYHQFTQIVDNSLQAQFTATYGTSGSLNEVVNVNVK